MGRSRWRVGFHPFRQGLSGPVRVEGQDHLDPAGQGILLKGSWQDIAISSGTAMIGIAALAGGAQGWLLKKTNIVERLFLIVAGVALVYPHVLADGIGIGLILVVLAMQKFRP